MLDPISLGERLARLLPRRVREEVFIPALQDLRIQGLTEQRGSASSRAPRPLRSHGRVIALFLDCVRVSLLSWPASFFSTFPTEMRHAFGRLKREPGFTAAAVFTLALGVGLTVAVFAVFEAVLLRPLPYAEADRLVILNHRDVRSGITKEFIAIGDWVDIESRQRKMAGLATYGGGTVTVYGEGDAFRVRALVAGPDLLDVLRVRPALGRGLEPADHLEGAADVGLIGHRLWLERFGADPAVVGRSVTVEDTRVTIVGVVPPGFSFPPGTERDLVLPMSLPREAPAQRKAGWVFAVGRLAPEETAESVTQELALISTQMEAEHPEQNAGSSYYVEPLRDQMVGGTKQALGLLMAAVSFVLLIACVNVANLQLARSLGRRREIAVRLAIGAGRARVAAQFLAESLAVACLAGVAGVALASWGARALVTLVPDSARAPGLADVQLNPSVLGFALLVTLLAPLTFGFIAAATVRLEDAGGVLVTAGRASAGRGMKRAAFGLVAGEIALALVLLFGAGLVLRSFTGLLAVDPGFDATGVLVAEVQLPAERYAAVDARAAFHRAFRESLLATPGVEQVGIAVVTPLTGNNWTAPFERLDRPVPAGERPPDVGWQSASGGYFAAMGIPLVTGRVFDERDGPGSPSTVIVSRAIEGAFFGGESALGQRVNTGAPGGSEIVGVVGDIRRAGLTDQPRQDLYFPAERNAPGQITFFVKTTLTDPATLAPTFRSLLLAQEPNAMLLGSVTMNDVARGSVGTANLLLWLLGVFSACALALAAVGIYGVMSYVVRQRTSEIGMRMAVGATRRDILGLVLRDGSMVAAVGVTVGLLIGITAARALRSVLFGVTITDPATLTGAAFVLAVTTVLASLVPARRAASVDAARTLGRS